MTEVGQAQVLSALTKYALDTYRPERFALLGCATGNGLEHVNPEITKKVYALDINPDYLNKTREKFEHHLKHLEVINADIQKESLHLSDIDLLFAGLVLEYVDPVTALDKMYNTLGHKGVLFVVLQKSHQASFVTETRYTALEKLSAISHEVDEAAITEFLHTKKMTLVRREDIRLTGNKSFTALEFRKEL